MTHATTRSDAALEAPHPTKERLLRAAVQLFQRQGFAATGLSEILERARAPKGSLYHHFPGGKEALAVAGIIWLRAEVRAYLEEGLAQDRSGKALVLGMARRAGLGLTAREGMRGSLLSVLVQEAVPTSDAITEAVRTTMATWTEHLAMAFRRDGADARAAMDMAQMAFVLIEGAMVMARLSGRPDDVEALVAQGWGLYPAAEPSA